MTKSVLVLLLLIVSSGVRSETVDVKYRGPVDLKTFECREVRRGYQFVSGYRLVLASAFIGRLKF
jgi:hypothetical protein